MEKNVDFKRRGLVYKKFALLFKICYLINSSCFPDRYKPALVSGSVKAYPFPEIRGDNMSKDETCEACQARCIGEEICKDFKNAEDD